MKRRTFSLIAASAVMVSACASLAPYGPQQGGRGQGYAEQRIESDRYRITYAGVGNTVPVADRAIYRAGQLTVEQGYDWFEVTQRWIDGRPDSTGGLQPSVAVGLGSSNYGRYRSSGVGVGLGFDLSGPQPTSITLEIVMGRGQRPDRPDAYDARGVQDAIRPRL